MIEMTIGEWKKEARYLYLLLKEQYEDYLYTYLQDQGYKDLTIIRPMIESMWKVYQIEKNLKPEDYE